MNKEKWVEKIVKELGGDCQKHLGIGDTQLRGLLDMITKHIPFYPRDLIIQEIETSISNIKDIISENNDGLYLGLAGGDIPYNVSNIIENSLKAHTLIDLLKVWDTGNSGCYDSLEEGLSLVKKEKPYHSHFRSISG